MISSYDFSLFFHSKVEANKLKHNFQMLRGHKIFPKPSTLSPSHTNIQEKRTLISKLKKFANIHERRKNTHHSTSQWINFLENNLLPCIWFFISANWIESNTIVILIWVYTDFDDCDNDFNIKIIYIFDERRHHLD